MQPPDGWRRVAITEYATAGTPALPGAVWYVDTTTGAATHWCYDEDEAVRRAWALKERLERMLVGQASTRWHISHRADPRAAALADRHYNRQKIGSPQFVPPGRCLVLLTGDTRALWVTSWPFAEYVRHAWAGAWVNSLFRNEGAGLSSDLIREAVAATRWYWSDVPPLGMVTFVDAGKVRHKRDPGRCYRKAGFRPVGTTVGGLVALQLLPDQMPAPVPPLGAQLTLFEEAA